MATYVPYARSNYFAVKDPAAFESFCHDWDLRRIEKEAQSGQPALFGFVSENEEGIPTSAPSQDSEGVEERDFIKELSSHLDHGWVAVVREIGHEKMRYLTGFTIAVNSAGERIDVNLDTIYDDAKRLGTHVTLCEF